MAAQLMVIALAVIVALSACASEDPDVVDEAERTQQPTAAPTPTEQPPTPTPVEIPTVAPTATTAPTPAATTQPTAPVATTVPPTATAMPVSPTPTTAPPVPTATPSPPRPTTAPVPPTPVPPTPTPWINPDCYVGPGAADEPVWWCGDTICHIATPHPGCPLTPPILPVQIGCVISPQRNVVVEEVLTFTAVQKPSGTLVDYVFDHGDGTLDRASVSHAYYAKPGSYDVYLRWSHAGGKGSTFCGTVVVTAAEPIFVAGHYVGRTLQSATDVAISKGFVVRIVRIDDQVYPGTSDYRTDRVNFEIDANVVTKATLG